MSGLQDLQQAYLGTRARGRRGEFALMEDIGKAAELLAKLHLCPHNPPSELDPSIADPGLIRANYASKRRDLKLFRKMAIHRLYPTAFDQLFLKAHDCLANQLRTSQGFLADLDSGDSWDPAQGSGCCGLLLGGCYGRDFVVTDNGCVYLRKQKGPSWGLLALDVASFLSNVGYFTGWSLRAGCRALARYRKIRPLGRDELQDIHGLGVFPERTWHVAYEYYKGRRRQDDGEAAEALGQAIARDVAAGHYWRWVMEVELDHEDRH